MVLTDPQLTFLPDLGLPACGRLVVYDANPDTAGGEGADAALRSWCTQIGLGATASGRVRLAVLDDGGPRIREWPVRLAGVDDGLPVLLGLALESLPKYRRLPDTLTVWALAAHLGVDLVRTRHLVPALLGAAEGAGTQDHGANGGQGQVTAAWQAMVSDDAALARLAAALPVAGHAVALGDEQIYRPRDLLQAFLDAIADHAVRHTAPASRSTRPRARLLPWTARWAEALGDPADPVVPLGVSVGDPSELVAGVAAWRGGTAADTAGVAELRLHAPARSDGGWRLDLGVRTDTGRYVPAVNTWAGAGAADPDDAGEALTEALLLGLAKAARVFPPLDQALLTDAPESVELSLAHAWEFVDTAAPLLAESGLVVALPEDLDADRRLRVRMRVGVDPDGGEADDPARQGALGLRDLTGFRWEAALGDEVLSGDELVELSRAEAPLVHWRGRWLRVDRGDIQRLTTLRGPGHLALGEALALGLAGALPADADDPLRPWADWDPAEVPARRSADHDRVEVTADGPVAELLNRLQEAAHRPPVPASPDGFTGVLRDYQRRGVSWLGAMNSLGLGAVLADDMGLGKGIQLIAHLLTLTAVTRETGADQPESSGPFLVVCPTSVVGNWARELARFAPQLKVRRHHGPQRATTLDDVGACDVVLSSYATVRRDIEMLSPVPWAVMVLDEAQHVKNPATAGARAVRRIQARQTVTMTGTPLENRLSEVWSILDVSYPGLLGSRRVFTRRFVAPVERRRDPGAAERLRRMLAPFILRREKSDPLIAGDLPEKIERTLACSLTEEQATLYQQAVDRVLDPATGALRDASAMERRGRILALLTALKQICNHPAQYLGEPSPRLAGRSGKLAAARELVREAVEAGDQVLVFTQYVTMGRLLAQQFAADLGVDVPFLHGGVPATARERMVARFQGETGGDPPPVLVVSLRAGGTGLNLTAATQVLHYDRWWNPAVEDQATDRAHRIGQTRTVRVHKMVTAGTVEERIAELLEDKRWLARAVVGQGETWLGDLSDADLAELVALRSDARVDELDDDDLAEAS